MATPVNVSKKPTSTKENPHLPLSTSAKPTLGLKPLQTQPSSLNGAKDEETAALVASLQGQSLSLD